MAFRIEKAIAGVLAAALLPALAQAPLTLRVRHEHWRKHCEGDLSFNAGQVSYAQTSGKQQEHKWTWPWQEVQQLMVAKHAVRLLTYSDSKWKLGTDQSFSFTPRDGDFQQVYAMFKDRKDVRFTAALADADLQPDWEIPAKLVSRAKGSQGVLRFSGAHIVFASDKEGASRTWRLDSLESISSANQFELTITTWERARAHYGSLKSFPFQLKAPLTEERYQNLWRRLNQTKGLPVLTSLGAK